MSVDVETNAVAASPRQARARGRLRLRLRRVLSAIASRFSSSLTRRILVLNLGGLVALLVGFLYLNQFRAGLIDARVQSLQTQGEIIAAAVASSATVETDALALDPEKLLQLAPGQSYGFRDESDPGLEFSINPERIGPVLRRLVSPTSSRRARWNYRNSDSARVDSNVPPEAFPVDQWGHVVVSYDRGGNATTYVNGNLIDTRSLGANGTTFQAEGMTLNIGQDGAGNYSSDQVAAYDEVAFWNRVITQQEAALIYQSGAAGRSFLAAPPAAISVAATLANGDVKLSWTGGTAPFLVQGATTLGGAWTDIVTTSASEVTIPAVGPAAFLRVQDGTTKTVRLFKANISPAQEVAAAPVVSPASGKGFFSVNGLNANYYISFDGTVGNVTASHLHNAAAGSNGGVFFHLAPSPNFPAGTRGGIITGTQVLTAPQLTEIENGRTYITIPSAAFPGGELRGQLLP